RPVFALAVVGLPLEVVVGKPQRETPPDVGLAAEQPRAHPGVFRSGVWMVFLVDQDVLDVVAAVPAAHVRIHVLVRRSPRVRRLADGVLVVAEGVRTGRETAAPRI